MGEGRDLRVRVWVTDSGRAIGRSREGRKRTIGQPTEVEDLRRQKCVSRIATDLKEDFIWSTGPDR